MTVVLGIAVAIGVAVGLAGGGSLANLASHRLRGVALLVVGAGLQAAVLAGWLGLGRQGDVIAILVSYAGLAAFAGVNLLRPGMGILMVGVLLNAIPIAADRGMPVERHAIVAARVADAADVPLLDFGNKRHLAGPGDDVRILDDRLPDWVSHQVLSVGDLVITVGVAAIIAGLLDDPRRHPRGNRLRGRHAPSPARPIRPRGRHAQGRRGQQGPSHAGPPGVAPPSDGPEVMGPQVAERQSGGTRSGGTGSGGTLSGAAQSGEPPSAESHPGGPESTASRLFSSAPGPGDGQGAPASPPAESIPATTA